MTKPLFVISGDIHFNPTNLELATKCTLMAQNTARELGIPLVLNGDTLDQKDIIRAKVANRLIEILKDSGVKTYINVGNHDLANTHGHEHALNFLRPYATVIDTTTFVPELNAWVIPYHHNPQEFLNGLASIPKYSTIIVHQGLSGALAGDYLSDPTALRKEAFADYRTIASHYHAHQSVACGPGNTTSTVGDGQKFIGLFTYIGSPYSLSFGESFDGPKGYGIYYDDGRLEFVATNTRKHVVLGCTTTEWSNFRSRYASNVKYSDQSYCQYFKSANVWPKPDDLIWVKLSGSESDLSKISKTEVGETLFGHCNFRFDKIPTEKEHIKKDIPKNIPDHELLDSIIVESAETDEQKDFLKKLWRKTYEAS